MKFFIVNSFLLLSATVSLHAEKNSDMPVLLRDASDLLLIGKHVSVYEDNEGRLALDDILAPAVQQKFMRNNADIFSRPATASAFWFKFTIQNQSAEDTWLEIGSTLATNIDFYSPDTAGKYGKPHMTGSLRPDNSKFQNVNLFWLPLNKAGESLSKTYYIRIEEAMPFEAPLQIGTLRSLNKGKQINDFLTAGFIAVMLFMLFYNAFLYVSTRDNIYVPYLAYIILALVTNTFLNNYPYVQYINLGGLTKEWWQQNFLLWHPPINIAIGLFCIGYLGLATKLPRVQKFIWLQMGITGALFPVLTLFGAPLCNLVNVYQPFALLLPLTCLGAAFYLYRRGDKSARYYMLGWTFFVVGICIFIGVINGVIPYNPFTRNTLYFGISAEVMLFSLALTDRLKIANRKTLEQRDGLLRQASHMARIGGWEFLPRENLFHWSEITREMYDAPPDFIPTQSNALSFYKDRDSRKQIRRAFLTCLQTGQRYDVALELTTVKGRIVWIRTIGEAEFVGGQCQRIHGTCQDITTEKLAEIELWAIKRKAETADQKFRLLAEYSSDPLMLFDDSGIIECNPAAVKILGARDRSELIGKHPALFSPERQADGRVSSDKSREMYVAAREQGAHRFEWTHLTLDNREFPVEVTLIPVTVENKQTMLVVWHDLTEIKQQQENLVAAKLKAEAATNAKSEFLSTMSHEIRTPMSGLIGMASLLIETNLDEDQKRYVEVINRSGENLMHLIDDILDFSRIEAGKLDLMAEPFDPVAICEEIVELMSAKAVQRKNGIMTNIDPQIRYLLLGDEFRLKQILANLVGNAVKFTAEGAILVTLKQIEYSDEFATIEFSVADTGIGIPQDKIDSLFAPFTQVDGSISRRYGGSGLGLSICQRLIDLMQGQIFIESKEGRGTTVTVRLRLPVEKLVIASTKVEPDFNRDGSRLHSEAPLQKFAILVVDDDEVIRTLLSQMLSQLGHQVDTAIDGLEAIEKWQAQKYDIITMDWHMPRLSGHEATQRIRQLSGSPELPIIISISGQVVDENSQSAISAGANDCLIKPFTFPIIQKTVRKWGEILRQRKYER